TGGGPLTAKRPPAGPAPPWRPVCAPGAMPLHPNADRRREAMFTCKTEGPLANSAGHRMPWKLMVAGAFVACALGAFALKTARATDPQGFTATNLVGPVTLDEFDTRAHPRDWKVRLNAESLSDRYRTASRLWPGWPGG